MVGAKSQRGISHANPPVEETRDAIERWLQRLGLGTEIAVIVLMEVTRRICFRNAM